MIATHFVLSDGISAFAEFFNWPLKLEACEITVSVNSVRVESSLCATSCWELALSGKQNPSHVDKSVVKIVIHDFTPNAV